ncbi:hypothetical protein D3C87_1388670 [compost metagenome]
MLRIACPAIEHIIVYHGSRCGRCQSKTARSIRHDIPGLLEQNDRTARRRDVTVLPGTSPANDDEIETARRGIPQIRQGLEGNRVRGSADEIVFKLAPDDLEADLFALVAIDLGAIMGRGVSRDVFLEIEVSHAPEMRLTNKKTSDAMTVVAAFIRICQLVVRHGEIAPTP